MFPYISDLINFVFGTHLVIPLYTYGVFLVLAILVAFVIGFIEMKRKEKAGQIPENSHRYILFIFNVTMISGFLGNKLFHILDHWGDFTRDPASLLFSLNGQSFYGGLLVATFVVSILTYKKKIGLLQTYDIASPGILLGLAVGRLGCHFSGDGCWGKVNMHQKPDWLGFIPDWICWSTNYPHNVINSGIPIPGCTGNHCFMLPEPVFPTAIYDSFLALFFFLVLWNLRKFITVPGLLFSLFLICNGLSRFFLEFIRVNPKLSFVGIELSQAQIIALILILVGIVCFVFFIRENKKILPGTVSSV